MKIYLDDYRTPTLPDDWVILRNYPEFTGWINKHGLPEFVSFDHDLADGHYHQNMQEGVLDYGSKDFSSDDFNKTGYHCAMWMVEYCLEREVPIPRWDVHSMNPVGAKNIRDLLNQFN